MSAYIFVTNIFECSNIRIYSSHSGLGPMIFSTKRSGFKTFSLTDTVLNHPTSEWAGSKIYKVSLSTCVLENLEHQLQNEVCVCVCVRKSVTYRYREFCIFFGGIGTGIRLNWYRKKILEPVSEKFGTRKSLGTGIENI